MISYAQNFEDVILWRALKHVSDGFYIDIGANDPVIDSVSLAFYEQGWRGVHVEPMPNYAEALRVSRPDELVIEKAVSTSTEEIELTEFEKTGLTTGIKEYADRHEAAGYKSRALIIRPIPLSKVFLAAKRDNIHWLKVDVEGMEQDVLKSWGKSNVRPWIVVVEATQPLMESSSHNLWEKELLRRDYTFVYFDGVNRFYLHDKHSDLNKHFGPGPNYFDHFMLSSTTPFVDNLEQAAVELTAQAEVATLKANNAISQLDNMISGQASAIASAVDAVRSAYDETQSYMQTTLGRVIEERDTAVSKVSDLSNKLINFTADMERQKNELEAENEKIRGDAEIMRLSVERTHKEKTTRFSYEKAELQRQIKELKNVIMQRDNEILTLAGNLEKKNDEVLSLEKSSHLATEQMLARISMEKANTAAAEAALTKAELHRDAELERVGETNDQLQAEVNSRTRQITALMRENAQWRATNSELNVRINAMIESTSWRITTPVRWVGTGRLRAVSTAKKFIRPQLEAGMRFSQANPWIKPPILSISNFFPPLRRKIDRFWSLRQFVGSDPNVHSANKLTVRENSYSSLSVLPHKISHGTAPPNDQRRRPNRVTKRTETIIDILEKQTEVSKEFIN